MILPTALKAGHGCEGRMKVQCQEGFWRLRSHEVPFIRKKDVFLSDFSPQSHTKNFDIRFEDGRWAPVPLLLKIGKD